MIDTPPCPLCHHTSGPLFTKDGISYYTCPECTFQFSTPGENHNFKDDFSSYEPSYQSYFSDQKKLSGNAHQLTNWIGDQAKVTSSTRYLEIGCGSGDFLSWTKKHFNLDDAIGLEPSRGLFEHFQLENMGIRPLTLHDYVVSESPAVFDVVTFLDVLEHLSDVPSFFKDLERVTQPGSRVLFSTPTTDAFLVRVLGKRWHHYNRYHTSYFNQKCLDQFLVTSAFTPCSCLRLSKRYRLDYLLSYGQDFFFGTHQKISSGSLGKFTIPLNLFDIMYVTLERRV